MTTPNFGWLVAGPGLTISSGGLSAIWCEGRQMRTAPVVDLNIDDDTSDDEQLDLWADADYQRDASK
jgi:hypothetical protein